MDEAAATEWSRLDRSGYAIVVMAWTYERYSPIGFSLYLLYVDDQYLRWCSRRHGLYLYGHLRWYKGWNNQAWGWAWVRYWSCAW